EMFQELFLDIPRAKEHGVSLKKLDCGLNRDWLSLCESPHGFAKATRKSELVVAQVELTTRLAPGLHLGSTLVTHSERGLDGLVAKHPDLRRHLYTNDGKLRAFVNVYLNDEDVRYLQKEATAVKDSDSISIVPSIAGGKEDWVIRKFCNWVI